jgi:hypothetical protein
VLLRIPDADELVNLPSSVVPGTADDSAHRNAADPHLNRLGSRSTFSLMAIAPA